MDDLDVLVIADDPLVRAGLVSLLTDQPGVAVVGQVGEQDDAAEEIVLYNPDVVVWDLGWDPTLSLERLSDWRGADLPVVALLPDATHAVDAWVAGARGLLVRDVDAESLGAAVRAVGQQLVALDPALAEAVLPSRDPLSWPVVEELTPRESEVLQLMAEGLSNRSIAARLGISEHTVHFHVNGILSKLRAQSRTEAVVRATRLRLIIL